MDITITPSYLQGEIRAIACGKRSVDAGAQATLASELFTGKKLAALENL